MTSKALDIVQRLLMFHSDLYMPEQVKPRTCVPNDSFDGDLDRGIIAESDYRIR